MNLLHGKFFFIVFLISLTSCSFTQKTSRALLINSMDQSYDLIVVPGVPLEGEQWSSIMKARIYWSKYLFDKGIAKNIMYSGSSVYTPYYEAEVMAMFAKAIGIPEENIFTETKAEHSTENIYYSYNKAIKLGFVKIALATDPFQSRMLKAFVRKHVHESVGIIPIVFDTLKAMEPHMIDPEIDRSLAYNENFISIMDRKNFWQRFRGTRGLNLDENAYR